MKGEAKRRSSSRWGWVAFGVGLAICVTAGVTVGVLLGKSSGESDGDELQRAAAIALNTDRLNDDALSLAAAIEDAIAQEELESEAAMLRARLTALELRAERIRASADSQLSGEETNSRSGSGGVATARRSVRAIDATLAVFERKLVPELGAVLSTPRSTEATAGIDSSAELVAGVTQTLEEQERTLESVTSKLAEAKQGTVDTADTEPSAQGSSDSVSGRLGLVVEDSESELEVEYELHDFEAEVEAAGTNTEAGLAGTALGELALTNPTADYVEADIAALGVVLLWEEDNVPEEIRGVEIESAPGEETEEASLPEETPTTAAACSFELDGNRYCALLRFSFTPEATAGPAGVDLGPEETLPLKGPEPDDPLPIGEADPKPVIEAIEDNPPDLVQVTDLGVPAALRPACHASDTESEAGITAGLLSGDGTVIFEAVRSSSPAEAQIDEGSQLPDCWG